ncbi:NAD(P)-binding protein [Meredithblackwellia eburnea MCA 4105]
MTLQQTKVFLLGVGYIGGSVLQTLLHEKKYNISALVRDQAQAEKLKSMGVTPVLGSLDDDELIVKKTLESEIIIQTATASHQASVKSILTGLAQRPKDAKPAYFIHTSGAGILIDNAAGLVSSDKIYSDKHPEAIDALPPTAPHRDVDFMIRDAIKSGDLGSARVAILLPPCIYGIGTGPFNKLSIQIPPWIRRSLADKVVPVVGEGKPIWSNIHISNLMLAYLTLIHSLYTNPEATTSSPYFFATTGEHSWLSAAEAIRDALSARGLVSKDLLLHNDAGRAQLGTNSRSKGERLRELGWEPLKAPSVWECVSEEVEAILKEEH